MYNIGSWLVIVINIIIICFVVKQADERRGTGAEDDLHRVQVTNSMQQRFVDNPIFFLNGKLISSPKPKNYHLYWIVEMLCNVYLSTLFKYMQPLGVTKRCRLSWLTNGALVYEPKCGGRGRVAGSRPMSTAVHVEEPKLWGSLTAYLTYACNTKKCSKRHPFSSSLISFTNVREFEYLSNFCWR